MKKEVLQKRIEYWWAVRRKLEEEGNLAGAKLAEETAKTLERALTRASRAASRDSSSSR